MRSRAAELSDFMGPCRQTVVLMESSHESCSDEEAGGQQGLQAWVDRVNGACCLQHGIDVCREGSEVPWTCNAVCATAFIPFAEQCLGFGPDGPPPPPPSPQVTAFRTLCESPPVSPCTRSWKSDSCCCYFAQTARAPA